MFLIMPQLIIQIKILFRKHKKCPNIRVKKRDKFNILLQTLNWMILAEFLHWERMEMHSVIKLLL